MLNQCLTTQTLNQLRVFCSYELDRNTTIHDVFIHEGYAYATNRNWAARAKLIKDGVKIEERHNDMRVLKALSTLFLKAPWDELKPLARIEHKPCFYCNSSKLLATRQCRQCKSDGCKACSHRGFVYVSAAEKGNGTLTCYACNFTGLDFSRESYREVGGTYYQTGYLAHLSHRPGIQFAAGANTALTPAAFRFACIEGLLMPYDALRTNEGQ